MVADADWSILVLGVRKTRGDPGDLIDRLRAEHRNVLIQAADAQAVYGQEHVIEAFRIAIEAYARKVMIANKLETELLLRLACTDQISAALKKAGLKTGRPGCFIALSRDMEALKGFGEHLAREFVVDDSVLLSTDSKRIHLARDLALGKAYPVKFLDLLVERGAILVRR